MTGLHVGYVLKVYPRLSETFIVNEILELERLGVKVTIFSLRLPHDGRFHEKLARVQAEVVYLPTPTATELLDLVASRWDVLGPVRATLGAALEGALADGEVFRWKEIAKAVALHLEARARGVQHLHAHFATSSTSVAALAAELGAIPHSVTAHAKDIYLDAHGADAIAARLRAARFVVTVCDANRDHLEGIGRGIGPVHRIYNGLDLEEFRAPAWRPRSDRFEILGVGRLVPKKGFDTLVQACRALRDAGLDFRCRIVGTGVEADALAALAASEGVDDVVELVGPLSNEAVRERMIAADVVALPARVAADGNRDALPTVLLEALALGTPVVSTPVTGIPEILGGGEAGVLVPPDRPDALAAALAELAGDPARRVALGRAGRVRVERLFDVRHSVGELRDRFAASVGGRVAVAAGR